MKYIEDQTYTNRSDTRHLIKEVVQAAYDTVVSTMGPNGEVALIIEVNQPVVTKDGVRVAKALDLNDIRKNSIAKLITSAAIKTDEIVGDGTTTTVMMVKNLFEQFDGEMNFHTSRLIDELVKESKELLESLVQAITPDDERFARMVYTTSNYQHDISDRVVDLFKQFKNPNISLKHGNGNMSDVIDMNHSVYFDGKYATPQLQFGTTRGHAFIEDASVFIVNGDVRVLDSATINALVKHGIQCAGRPLIVFARSFDTQLLDLFVRINAQINKELGTSNNPQLNLIPFTINSPGSLAAETVNDLGKLLNVQVYNELEAITTIDKLDVSDVAFSIDISSVSFERLDGNIIDDRVKEILDRILPTYEGMNFTEKASYIGKFLFARIARLLAENVTIIVSGMTKAEISERYYLYEDAIRVAQSSIQFGVLPGIGWGYNQVAEILHDKYRDLDTSEDEQDRIKSVVVEKFISVLTAQYEYLSNHEYNLGGTNLYFDLVTLEETEIPTNVFDNGSAAIVAMEGGWSVVKRLCKMSCILGKQNTSYAM